MDLVLRTGTTTYFRIWKVFLLLCPLNLGFSESHENSSPRKKKCFTILRLYDMTPLPFLVVRNFFPGFRSENWVKCEKNLPAVRKEGADTRCKMVTLGLQLLCLSRFKEPALERHSGIKSSCEKETMGSGSRKP